MATATASELKMIDKSSLEFVKKELAGVASKNRNNGFTPDYRAIVEKARELDFFHMLLPESAGGIGAGLRALCTVLKNIAAEDASLGVILLTTLAAFELLLESGNGEILCHISPDTSPDPSFLIGFPFFSRPSKEQIAVAAHKSEGGYLLSGHQDYLVLAGLAEQALVPAVVSGENGFSFFLTDLTGPGVATGQPVRGLGLSACPAADVVFEKAPARKCCPAEEGERLFDHVESRFSIATAAVGAGLMQGSFQDALSYARQRSQGGRKIVHWSEVKRILSGMAMEIQLADMLISQSCLAMETHEKGWQAGAAAASLKISEMACKLTSNGIRVMGGVGYMEDFNQEKRFRDARHLTAAFGTAQTRKLHFLENHITSSARGGDK